MNASVVTPPSLAGPLRLLPFRARALAPRQVGDPASRRLFARPLRQVTHRMDQWEDRNRLRSDVSPALYLHEYTATGLTVRGLVGALDLTRRTTRSSDQAVFPHEGVHPRQADELADRMEEMQVNPAPILLVHRGSPRLGRLMGEISAGEPLWSFEDHEQQHHRVWALRPGQTRQEVQHELADSVAVIADGHHRYAAYLRVQGRSPGGSHDRGLAMLIDQSETPLQLGAIHRTLSGVRMEDVANACRILGLPHHPVEDDRPLDALTPVTAVVTDGRTWLSLGLPVDADHTAVDLFHELVIPALPRGPRGIHHHHSVEDALAARHPGSVSVLLPAATVDQVMATAARGHLLPEKATSFQPKPSLGVLIRALPDG
ncbi:DUF1015 family protein [Nocardioides insulae]|uniref:DUF1015 family protein n=1 Tax=Nocardioides insulae TaxID=394734 RepID=UPI00048DDE0E|nr:DUF1015 family protein [Nocardioides insulae]